MGRPSALILQGRHARRRRSIGILLLLLGLLAAGSGGFKLTRRVRALVGRSALAVAELALGTLTVLGSGVGLARARPLAWVVVSVVAATVVWSSITHVRRSARYRDARITSEASRLRRFIDP